MRLFISINLSEKCLLQLEKWQNELQVKGVQGYWRKRDNLHLTLRFLGDIEQSDLRRLQDALSGASGHICPVELTIHRLGVFPNLGRPRVLWAGLKRELGLYRLQQIIENCTQEFGLREDKEYKPHLTLATGGISGLNSSIFKWAEELEFVEEVTHFHLMNSVVEKGVRKYIVVNSYPI